MLTVVNTDGTYSGVQYPEVKQEYIDHHRKYGQRLIWLDRKVNKDLRQIQVGIDEEGKPIYDYEPVVETATSEELSKEITKAEDRIELIKKEVTLAQDTTIMALDVAASIYEASLATEANALTALDVSASLYEELLTIKMQLEGGN